jgi:hypothetical protein
MVQKLAVKMVQWEMFGLTWRKMTGGRGNCFSNVCRGTNMIPGNKEEDVSGLYSTNVNKHAGEKRLRRIRCK